MCTFSPLFQSEKGNDPGNRQIHLLLLHETMIGTLDGIKFDHVIFGKSFDRKIEIDKVFLDSLQEADITKRNYLEQADHLLILQGTKDEIVPFEAVKAFAEDNVIEFEPIEGADHRFMNQEKMDLAISLIITFLGLK